MWQGISGPVSGTRVVSVRPPWPRPSVITRRHTRQAWPPRLAETGCPLTPCTTSPQYTQSAVVSIRRFSSSREAAAA
jgi:hypothetical protein